MIAVICDIIVFFVYIIGAIKERADAFLLVCLALNKKEL